MSQSKAQGQDYSECEFQSDLPGPFPSGIRKMFDRAFKSMGTDIELLGGRWTEPVAGTGKNEADYFGFKGPERTDICCADTAAFVIHQTGVLDITRGWPVFRSPEAGPIDFHGAPYWIPDGRNDPSSPEPRVRLVKRSDRDAFFKDADKHILADDFLPGDYFLYAKKEQERHHPPGEPSHINVYLGPFREVVDGVRIDPVFHFINGSIGTGGSSAFVGPRKLSELASYYLNPKYGWIVYQCRVLAVEQLFSQLVGVPLNEAEPAPTAKTPSRADVLEIFYKQARESGAPFPVGSNRTWHDGVHLPHGGHLADDNVMSCAPGEVVLARLPPTAETGDTGFVFVKHRYDPSRKIVLSPPRPGQPADSRESDAIVFYSMYLHLQPASKYLNEDGSAQEGAPPWVAGLVEEPVPEFSEFLPGNCRISLIAPGANDSKVALDVGQTQLGGAVLRAELETVTAGGSYFAVRSLPSHSNVDNWSGTPLAPSVTAGHKLCFYNRVTGETFELDYVIPAGTSFYMTPEVAAETLSAAAGNEYVRIEFERPGVDLSSTPPAPEPETPAGAAAPDPNEMRFAQPEIALWLKTTNEGAKRYFPDSGRVNVAATSTTLRFCVSERKKTGTATTRDRAWLDLVPCAKLSASEKSTLDTQLAAIRETPVASIYERLRSGKSRLLGVVISPGEGWQLDGGLLFPTQARINERDAKKKRIRMYPGITGTGDGRRFLDPIKTSSIDAEGHPLFMVDPSANPKIVPLEVFTSGGVKRALVEVRVAAPEASLANNQGEIDRITKRNKARKSVRENLLKGDPVLLKDAELAPVGRHSIGKIGRPGSGPKRAIHFATFSAVNLIDKNKHGAPDTLELIPNGKWRVLKDDRKEGLITAEFVEKTLGLLLGMDDIQPRTLRGLASGSTVVTESDWVEFCKSGRNDRALASVIALHPAEWSIDWHKDAGESTSRSAHLTEGEKTTLEGLQKAFAWFKGNKLDGLDSSGSLFFYHPLRLIEWLTTGLDIGVSSSKPAKVKLTTPGRDPLDLERDPDTLGYPYRTLTGDVVPTLDCVLELEDVKTTTKRIPVRITRGETRRIVITEPGVRVSVEREPSAIDYTVAVDQRAVDGPPFLLGDDNLHLADSGYSRATFRAEITYNIKPPETLKARLTQPGFKIVGWQLGDLVDVSGKKEATAIRASSIEIRIPPPPASTTPFTQYRTCSLRIDVVAENTIPASTDVEFTVSGGDLEGEVKPGQNPRVETREIKATTKDKTHAGTLGEDIAKVQLYLSQIFEDADEPCYRAIPNGIYNPEKPVPIVIDGCYTEELARGLWRFIYRFAGTLSFARMSMPMTDKDGGPKPAVTSASITPQLDVCTEGDSTFATFLERTTGTPTEYPVINRALLDEIHKRFRAPFVLPRVRLAVLPVEGPRRPAPRFPPQFKDKWRDTLTGTSTIVAGIGDEITISIKCPELARIGGTLAVEISVPATSAYAIQLGPGPATSVNLNLTAANAVAGVTLRLGWSGATTTTPADNVVIAKSSDGLLLGSIQLAGSRDLTKVHGDYCRDALIVQYLLSQVAVPNKNPAEPYLKSKVVDGNWGAGSLTAFSSYKATLAAGATLAAVLSQLREAAMAQ